MRERQHETARQIAPPTPPPPHWAPQVLSLLKDLRMHRRGREQGLELTALRLPCGPAVSKNSRSWVCR